WTITNGTINSGQGTNSIIWTAGSTSPVTLNVQVSTAAGCPATGSKQVTVNPLPSCTITGGNAVCGASTNNTYSGPAGPNRSYAWQISGDGSINGANNAQNVSVNAGASGSFTLTLTVTDTQTGCSSVCAKTVTVNPLPSCSIMGPSTVCSSSTSNTYSGPAGANLSYVWQISGSGSINGASNAQNVSVNAGVSGSFTLTLTVTNTQTGCSSVCTKTVTIGESTNTTITAPDAVCALSTGNTASVPNAGQGATYNWTITNGTITSGQGTNSITWTAGSTSPVTLNVQVSTAAGCPATGSKQVTVKALPSADAGPDQTKCQNESGTTSFTVTGVVTAGSATPFWSVFGTTGTVAATIVSPNNLTTQVNVTGVGAVTLRLRSATASCGTATDDVVLTVSQNAGVTITSLST